MSKDLNAIVCQFLMKQSIDDFGYNYYHYYHRVPGNTAIYISKKEIQETLGEIRPYNSELDEYEHEDSSSQKIKKTRKTSAREK